VFSVGLLLFLSLLGLPVLAGGGAGFAIYLGPTGGFLIGYLVCAFIVGQISNKGKSDLWKYFFIYSGSALVKTGFKSLMERGFSFWFVTFYSWSSD
jgi:biotin transport system substrate-specific component